MSAAGTTVRARRPNPMPAWKIHFYRQCRLWHGWLSAFAFIALMFFSTTGILLNHPDWFAGATTTPVESKAHLPADAVKIAQKASRPAPALAALLTGRALVHGVYASGDIDDGIAFLRFEGVTGNTSVTLDMETGTADIAWQKATALTMMDDLHRGKNAGAAWKWLMDITAGLFLLLSLIGYILFFSMRHRLPQTIAITLGSLAVIVALFLFCVP